MHAPVNDSAIYRAALHIAKAPPLIQFLQKHCKTGYYAAHKDKDICPSLMGTKLAVTLFNTMHTSTPSPSMQTTHSETISGFPEPVSFKEIKTDDPVCESMPEFHFAPFAEAQHDWRKLLTRSSQATLYHDEAWLSLVSRAYGLKLWLATVASGNDVRAGSIFARTNNPLKQRLLSLPFSDCCRPLGADTDCQLLLNAIACQRSRRSQSWEVRGFAAYPPWQIVNCFENWSLDLARPRQTIEGNLHGNFRRMARRTERDNLRIERGSTLSFVRRFYSMHLETRRRLGVPVQPFRFFKLVQETFALSGAFEVWIASHNGRDAAGLVLLRHGDRLYYKWGARRVSEPGNANFLLVWSVVEEYANKVAFLDLGRTDRRNEGLTRFKKHLGARPTPLPYAFLPRAPREISPEASGRRSRELISRVWKRLPLPVTRILGGLIYSLLV